MYGIDTNSTPYTQISDYNGGYTGQVSNTQPPFSGQMDVNPALIGPNYDGQHILPFPCRPNPIDQLMGMIAKLVDIIKNLAGLLTGQASTSNSLSASQSGDTAALSGSPSTSATDNVQQDSSGFLSKIFDFGSWLFSGENNAWEKIKDAGLSIWKGASSLFSKFASRLF